MEDTADTAVVGTAGTAVVDTAGTAVVGTAGTAVEDTAGTAVEDTADPAVEGTAADTAAVDTAAGTADSADHTVARTAAPASFACEISEPKLELQMPSPRIGTR